MLLALRQESPFAAADVAAIETYVPPHMAYVDAPTDVHTSAKGCEYSMQYSIACAVLDGEVTLAQFQRARIEDPAPHAMGRKVSVRALDSAEPRRFAVVLRLKDGRRLHRETRSVHGDPDDPLTDGELSAKLAGVLGRDRAEQVVQAVWSLESAADVGALMRCLRG